MVPELDQSTPDVNAEVSSAPETSSDSSVQSAPEAPAAEGSTQQTKSHEQYVPYERFQEVINFKNEASKRLEEYERKFAELSASREAPKAEAKNPRIEKFRSLDADLGSFAEEHEATKTELAALKQWRAQQEQDRIRSTAESMIDKFNTENKIGPELKQFYLDVFKQRAVSLGNKMNLDMVPSLYKQVHEEHSKYMTARERDIIAKYSTEKAKDVSVPTTKRSESPTKAPSNKAKTQEELRSEAVKEYVRMRKASRE